MDQLWICQHRKDADKLDQVQSRATKSLRRLKDLPCKERLRDWGLFSLERSERTISPLSSTERRWSQAFYCSVQKDERKQ